MSPKNAWPSAALTNEGERGSPEQCARNEVPYICTCRIPTSEWTRSPSVTHATRCGNSAPPQAEGRQQQISWPPQSSNALQSSPQVEVKQLSVRSLVTEENL